MQHSLSNTPCLEVKTSKHEEFTHFPVHLAPVFNCSSQIVVQHFCSTIMHSVTCCYFQALMFLSAGIFVEENMYGCHASEVSWPIFSGGCAPGVLAFSIWCPKHRVTPTVLQFLLLFWRLLWLLQEKQLSPSHQHVVFTARNSSSERAVFAVFPCHRITCKPSSVSE